MRSRRAIEATPAKPEPGVQHTRVLAMVSLLVGYPDGQLLADLPLLASAARQIAGPSGQLLARFIDRLGSTPADQSAAGYVETFDLRRRCCLYLTYYAHGDTRKRGAALIRFTHAYRVAGFPPPQEELADHLGVVCNFAALVPGPGFELLREHRVGIELLRMALAEIGSPYLDVLDALRCILAAPSETDLSRALALARLGPPAEEVGLEPFGPPEYTGVSR